MISNCVSLVPSLVILTHTFSLPRHPLSHAVPSKGCILHCSHCLHSPLVHAVLLVVTSSQLPCPHCLSHLRCLLHRSLSWEWCTSTLLFCVTLVHPHLTNPCVHKCNSDLATIPEGQPPLQQHQPP